jgi:flagellar hook-associated protein FlgK
MAFTPSIALSAMHAAQASLNVAAHNIANLQTPGFHRQQLVRAAQTDGGVSATITESVGEGTALEQDVIAQLQAKNAFLANLAVFRTSNQMAGALLKETV